MKIALAGAFGNLGIEILKKIIDENHEVVALKRCGRIKREIYVLSN